MNAKRPGGKPRFVLSRHKKVSKIVDLMSVENAFYFVHSVEDLCKLFDDLCKLFENAQSKIGFEENLLQNPVKAYSSERR